MEGALYYLYRVVGGIQRTTVSWVLKIEKKIYRLSINIIRRYIILKP
jgi:hypothetical protein